MRRPVDNPQSPRGRAEPFEATPRPPGPMRLPAWAAFLALMSVASPALATDEAGRRPSDGPGPAASTTAASHRDRAGRPRRPGPSWLGGEAGGTGSARLDGGWTGIACFALVLAACGGFAVAARRLAPRAAAGAVQVVGRVSLSPKHSVYLLRVGQRVLVVGAGPQGPPALITELEGLPQAPPPSPRQEVES